MNEECVEDLKKAFTEADTKLNQITHRLNEIRACTDDGLTLAEAKILIQEIWENDPLTQSKLFVKLSSTDLRDNAYQVTNAYLPPAVVSHLLREMPSIVEYLDLAQSVILEAITRKTAELTTSDVYDEEAQPRYDRFRKEVLRYTDYLTGYSFDAVNDWDGLTWEKDVPDTEAVVEGNYLFLDDLVGKVEQAHQEFKENRLKVGSDRLSLGEFKWNEAIVRNCLKLPICFAGYLSRL